MNLKINFRNVIFGLSLLGMVACNDAPSSDKSTILTGRSVIYVDETLASIVKEQVDVFQYSYKHAEISLVSKPENLVVNALMQDSTEIVVLTRLLNEKELSYFRARQFEPRVTKFATDAIALVTHKSSTDTLIRVEDLIDILQGKQQKALVFDNPNSSTVRMLKELAGVDTLPKSGIYGLKSNEEVLQYVASHQGAIGVVGVSWLLRPDSSGRQWINDVKVLHVKNAAGNPGDDGYYQPTQSNLAEGKYALSRPVYLINGEPRNGLGIGFASFVYGDRGQRIILRAGLMPDSLPHRQIIIRKK